MSQEFLIIGVLVFVLVGMVVYYATLDSGKGSAVNQWLGGKDGSSKLKTLVQAQRANTTEDRKGGKEVVLQAGMEFDLPDEVVKRKETDLAKKLYYANLSFTPGTYWGILIGVICFFIALALIFFPPPMRFAMCMLSIILPTVTINGLIGRRINKRVDAFDKDYVELLLTLVSLLKTGMGPLQALESAARNLDEDAVCRAEVMLLMERLRMGLTEEQAIGAFGEDIDHKEIELFVQSLLLSRSAGGKLSDTLERLARQVRKRQQFRKQAKGAVGMERGSMYAVAMILGVVVSFVFISSTDLREAVTQNDGGLTSLSWSIVVVTVGFLWMNAVSKIKI